MSQPHTQDAKPAAVVANGHPPLPPGRRGLHRDPRRSPARMAGHHRDRGQLPREHALGALRAGLGHARPAQRLRGRRRRAVRAARDVVREARQPRCLPRVRDAFRPAAARRRRAHSRCRPRPGNVRLARRDAMDGGVEVVRPLSEKPWGASFSHEEEEEHAEGRSMIVLTIVALVGHARRSGARTRAGPREPGVAPALRRGGRERRLVRGAQHVRCAAAVQVRRQPADDPRGGGRGGDGRDLRGGGADVPLLAQQHARGLHHGPHPARAQGAHGAAARARARAPRRPRDRGRGGSGARRRNRDREAGRGVRRRRHGRARHVARGPEQPDGRVGAGREAARATRCSRARSTSSARSRS